MTDTPPDDSAQPAEGNGTPKKRTRAKDDGGMAVVLSSTPAEFVIAPKGSAGDAGVQMLSDGGGELINRLRNFSGLDIEIVRTTQPGGPLAMSGGSAETLLVRMDAEKGRQLEAQSTAPSTPIWVESNERLDLLHGFGPLWGQPTHSALFDTQAAAIEVRVIGEAEAPLAGALVTAYGRLGMPVSARTDANGVAQISAPQSTLNAIAALVIDPVSMHWSKVVRDPAIQPGRPNVVRVQSFAEFDPQFHKRGASSWGVSRLGATGRRELTGAGVKIGVIDTGCDTNHPLLSHIRTGSDHNPNATADSWKVDEVGHGTHCAGVIGARAADGSVRGMAPEAEIYVYKVFPDASFFTLDAAMSAAIAQGVDILSMSLGSDLASNVLADRFEKARRAGVLCIVAAGNSGNGVKFPANLSSAVAVAAMGHTGAIPQDSISAQTYNAAFATDGDFSPRFTCFGSEIDFVAPGVGVISTVPGGLRAMDGTSMATPHVAGLAALALAHDPALRSAPKDATRLEMLVARLRSMASQLPWGSQRTGAGMPMLGISAPLFTGLLANPPWKTRSYASG